MKNSTPAVAEVSSPYGIIVCPTGVGAERIFEKLSVVVNHMNALMRSSKFDKHIPGSELRVAKVNASVPVMEQKEQLRMNGYHFLICTTGRLQNMVEENIVDLSRLAIAGYYEAERFLRTYVGKSYCRFTYKQEEYGTGDVFKYIPRLAARIVISGHPGFMTEHAAKVFGISEHPLHLAM
jgi:hypothetical protein